MVFDRFQCQIQLAKPLADLLALALGIRIIAQILTFYISSIIESQRCDLHYEIVTNLVSLNSIEA